jgi:serine/threonine protein phosphatase 1
MRTIAIGDIHGGYRALVQLLDRIDLRADDQLIFLGDYVDGWSQSFEVIDFLISLSRKRNEKEVYAEPVEVRKQNDKEVYTTQLNHPEYNILEKRPIFLRGNHDELVLEYFNNDSKNEMWLYHGGVSTVKSYKNRDRKAVDAHIRFLENDLHNFYELGGNGYFHAGFHNLKGPHYEYYENITYWDRSLWEMALALDPDIDKEDLRYPNRLKIYNEIYIGHTPTDRLGKHVPVNAANVYNVDTAAAYKGPLTAICVEDKTIWQSDPVYTLYPDEKGRN